jgi:hypothetical protein
MMHGPMGELHLCIFDILCEIIHVNELVTFAGFSSISTVLSIHTGYSRKRENFTINLQTLQDVI